MSCHVTYIHWKLFEKSISLHNKGRVSIHLLLFTLLSFRHRRVQFADTHLLEWQRVCEPPRRLRLCVYVWSGLQRRLPTGRGNQTQRGGLETQLWSLCYMLLQGTEDEHTHTNSPHCVSLVEDLKSGFSLQLGSYTLFQDLTFKIYKWSRTFFCIYIVMNYYRVFSTYWLQDVVDFKAALYMLSSITLTTPSNSRIWALLSLS